MGVQFRNAELTLDLLDRKGKYENGFMHAPRTAWFKDGNWSPAQINFTSNANPNQVGSGDDGLNTLFHEGGHAAHFANITQNAPCFSQEFPPTSMSYAETQSMFFDSMLADADWLLLYAQDKEGKSIPESLIQQSIESRQPFAAYAERGILVVPYFEWEVYSLNEEELTADKLIELARHWEKKIFGLDCAPRPILAIPHLLDQTAACSYQGYLLANMAVYQTRAWFKREHGYLTDNPAIGPLVSEHYWAPGNSVTHNDTLVSLTGEGFSGKYLAEHCNHSAAEAWQQAQQDMAAAKSRTQSAPSPLQASIRVVHGDELLAENRESDTAMFKQFENQVNQRYH
jgi:oligoendopeptidase F